MADPDRNFNDEADVFAEELLQEHGVIGYNDRRDALKAMLAMAWLRGWKQGAEEIRALAIETMHATRDEILKAVPDE
jgi:hypothetical protein